MAPYAEEPNGSVLEKGEAEAHEYRAGDALEIYHGQGLVGAWNKVVWHGGSAADAWLNAASAQVGQVILTLPYSLAQLGYVAGISFQIFYAALGCWTAYLLCCLFSEYRQRREDRGEKAKEGHVTQYHEVIGGLVGPWAGNLAIFFNIISLVGLGIVQIIACASNVYYMNSSLSKRDWEIVFGALATLTVLIPTFHNYRIWSFIGLVATTYTSWYMMGASVNHGQVGVVQHKEYTSLVNFFTGSTNILFAFGGHSITVEIMHAMWRPRKFGWVYLFASLYTFTLTIPNSVSVYWAYGDLMLKKSNALGVLPPSAWRDTAIVLMIIHQMVAFGLFVTPLYLISEKLFGVHHSKYYPIRVLARLPIAGVIWFLAIAFPFFGPINSIIGAFSTTFSTYIIPSLMFIIVYWSRDAKQKVAQPPLGLRNLNVAFAINTFVIISILVMGVAFGGWASIKTFIANINTYGVFESCYQCPVKPKTH